jgi:hypothetical protein
MLAASRAVGSIAKISLQVLVFQLQKSLLTLSLPKSSSWPVAGSSAMLALYLAVGLLAGES